MRQNQESADEIRSKRVDGLRPMMDEIYLFSCFHDNAKVLAATVLRDGQTRVPLDYGFVEYASHSDAEFVLESYNGEWMPNFNSERYCLSWDTDLFGTMWRWDYTYEACSFFGYDEKGKIMDAKALYPNSCGDSGDFTEIQLDHSKSNLVNPYMETNLDKRLKLTHPNIRIGISTSLPQKISGTLSSLWSQARWRNRDSCLVSMLKSQECANNSDSLMVRKM